MQINSIFYTPKYTSKHQNGQNYTSRLYPLQTDVCSFRGKIEEQINVANLKRHVNYLASEECEGRKPGTQGSFAASEYIIKNFKELGLKPFNKIQKDKKNNFIQEDNMTRYHTFTHEKMGDYKVRNVIGCIPAESDEYLFITAHYDHFGRKKTGEIFSGAEDNATGIAAILETARLLSNKHLSKNIVFIATDAEEIGLLGAKSLAGKIITEKIKDKCSVLNVDGAGAKGDWLSIVSNKETCSSYCSSDTIAKINLLKEMTEKSGKKLDIKIKNFEENFTDSKAFQESDIPAITYTWAKKGQFDDNPNRLHVHTPDDTPDKVEFENVKKTAEVLFNTILELCK